MKNNKNLPRNFNDYFLNLKMLKIHQNNNLFLVSNNIRKNINFTFNHC